MATFAKNCSGDPEIGDRHENGKWRAVIGWNHTNDTTEGLKEGKVWCWVSEPPEKLQIYDQSFNRSPIAGDVRFCGVANFTMVRMFHPYWVSFGRVPHDGHYKDKKRCRAKYHSLIRKHRLANGLPVDEDIGQYRTRSTNKCRVSKAKKKTARSEMRCEKACTPEKPEINGRKNLEQLMSGTIEVLAGGSKDDAILID